MVYLLAKSCIFKIIMGGASNSAKTTFINGTYFPFNDEEFFHIGVSFKLIDCLVNNEDSYLLQLWDFKVMEQFKCLYPSFCRGAKGALICFDVSDKKSFDEVHYWIKTIRQVAGKIPIILIGTKNDLKRVITDREINIIIKTYQLDGIFYTSKDNYNRKTIFKKLINKLDKISKIKEFAIFLPEYDAKFKNFIDFFSLCPICHRKNHFNYLKKFFYSRNEESIRLKDALLSLIEESNDFDELYHNNIEIGIPCCKCFEQLFGVKN